VKVPIVLALWLLPALAEAQAPVRKTVTFLAGAATGLVVHESGHVSHAASRPRSWR